MNKKEETIQISERTIEHTFLPPKYSNSLRGVLALMVLIAHIHGRIDLFRLPFIGAVLVSFGYLAVAGFMFLSGYGISESLKNKPMYVALFPLNKILPICIINALMIIIYLLRDVIFKYDIIGWRVLQSFLFGETIVDNGWYLQTLILLYIFFYISFRIFKERGWIAVSVLIFIYVILCYVFDLSSTWYETTPCFLLGMIFSNNKDKLIKLCSSCQRLLVSATCFFAFFAITWYLGNAGLLPYPLSIIIKMISALFFSVIAILVVIFVRLRDPITSFIGRISLEVYLLQGIFLNIFDRHLVVENDILYFFIVIICTVVVSFVTHPIFEALKKFAIAAVNNIFTKGNNKLA